MCLPPQKPISDYTAAGARGNVRTYELMAETTTMESPGVVAADPQAAKIYASFDAYRRKAQRWSQISEQAFLETRGI